MGDDYQFDEETGTLTVNLLGLLYGASIEDYEEVMSRVINYILREKSVVSVVLLKEREYEYGPDQTKMLVEIADIIEDIVKSNLIFQLDNEKYTRHNPHAARFIQEWTSKAQYIVSLIKKDPIGAYVETLREIRHMNIGRKTAPPNLRDVYSDFVVKILEVIKERFEKTELIKRVIASDQLAGYRLGDRSIYRDIFMPSVRPNFMLTRYMVTPPEKSRVVDRYTIEGTDIEVQVLRSPGEIHNIYHIVPPEFKLSEAHYTVLDAARRQMIAHQPKSAEFVKSEDRKYIYNIGEQLIRDIASRTKPQVGLTAEQLEQLATILTRYTAGLGVLEILLLDPKIQDIYINSPIERIPIFIKHQDFEECKTNLIPTREDADAWATRLRISSGRPLDEANPILDTEMTIPGARARFAVITKTLSPEGLGFAIRRHRDKPWTLPLFIRSNMLDPLTAGLLSFLMDNNVGLLVAGGRGSGKTSLLGSLISEMLPKNRIIVLEDTLELPVAQYRQLGYNIESLKSRSVITRVETEISPDEALRTALRLGDSSLIIGEIRSLEAKVLWEAMRIGALSSVVAGTIHADSAYGVFDRVVNDLGVPPTSFKATDIVCICRNLKTAGGLKTFKRLVQITEVRKHWDKDPLKEGGFVDLINHSFEKKTQKDLWKPSGTLTNGESEILQRISNSVKEWAGDWEGVWENIQLRAKMKQTMVEASEKLDKDPEKPTHLEADWVNKSNIQFHTISEKVAAEIGRLDSKRIYNEWLEWYKNEVTGKTITVKRK
ncbi:MAG: type II/IV secretion system ATPase subunit [Candidatus Aenigmarchaeota archaeon]|nr:type II/IV secretion system ATPase subunit [Candidatus Aenigmarchaeota archaeon]